MISYWDPNAANDLGDGLTPATAKQLLTSAESVAGIEGTVRALNYTDALINLAGGSRTYEFGQAPNGNQGPIAFLEISGGCTVIGYFQNSPVLATGACMRVNGSNDTDPVTLLGGTFVKNTNQSDVRLFNVTGSGSVLTRWIGCNFNLSLASGGMMGTSYYSGTQFAYEFNSCIIRGLDGGNNLDTRMFGGNSSIINCLFDRGGLSGNMTLSNPSISSGNVATSDCVSIPSSFEQINRSLLADPANNNFNLLPNSPALVTGQNSVISIPSDAIWMREGTGTGTGTEADPYYFSQWSSVLTDANNAQSKTVAVTAGTYVFSSQLSNGNNYTNLTFIGEDRDTCIFSDGNSRVTGSYSGQYFRIKNLTLYAGDHFFFNVDVEVRANGCRIQCAKYINATGVDQQYKSCIIEVVVNSAVAAFFLQGNIDILNCVLIDLFGGRTTLISIPGTMRNSVLYAPSGTQNMTTMSVDDSNVVFGLTSGFGSANTSDPLLADPANGNFDLLPNSPALLSSQSTFLPDPSDFTQVFYVSPTGAGSQDGSSEANAYSFSTDWTTLQASVSPSTLVIFVDGTYVGVQDRNWKAGTYSAQTRFGVKFTSGLQRMFRYENSTTQAVKIHGFELSQIAAIEGVVRVNTSNAADFEFYNSKVDIYNTRSGSGHFLGNQVGSSVCKFFNSIFRWGNSNNASANAIAYRGTVVFTNSTLYIRSDNLSTSMRSSGSITLLNSVAIDASGVVTDGVTDSGDSFVKYSARDDGDPLFADPDNGDFTLLPASPALA